jgi:hypothetical protein
MKKIFKYFGVFLSVVLMGALSSCTITEIEESADLGLGIKVFFPTKVVAGQPMTINGSGFSDVREVVFPGGVSVTNFELVSGEMIRVTAPSGISPEGGKLIVRSSDDEAESRLPLELGRTVVKGYSKQDGESISGGEQLTIYGEDLEFISSVELLDTDGNPLVLQDEDFYRKGTSTVVITIPKKTIFDGTFVGKVYTFDGREFLLPELTYEPVADGGHWETVKTVIWKNDGGSAVSWSGTYRYALEGHDGANECIAEIPQDIWDKMMTETFYLDIQATDPQVRITTGWWDPNWKVGDIQPGNELITDNGDGTWTVEINLTNDPDFVAALVDRHLLFTGDRYTPIEFYFKEDIWVDGGGHYETVKTDIWKGDGTTPAVSWSGTYRYALEGHDGANECIAEIPQDIWDKMMTETFYLDIAATDPQVRITTGWWDPNWKVGDIQPGNDLITDNGDGTWTVEINLTDDPDFVAALVDRHLLFTGDRYTPLEIYFKEEIWVDDGGGSGGKEDVFWENPGSTAVSWSGTYRFALEGHDGANECIGEFPQDVWDKIKTKTFYLVVEATDPQVRVTTGWWDPNWKVGDIQPGNELITDNGDGTWTVEINISDDETFVAALDERHLLFTGDRFTPKKLYFK